MSSSSPNIITTELAIGMRKPNDDQSWEDESYDIEVEP